MSDDLFKIRSDVEPAIPKKPVQGELRDGDEAQVFAQGAREWRSEQDRTRGELEIETIRQDMAERKKYAGKIYNLIVGWLIAVIALVWASACANVALEIPPEVQIALITGLSANVLGIFIFVVKYLFPTKP